MRTKHLLEWAVYLTIGGIIGHFIGKGIIEHRQSEEQRIYELDAIDHCWNTETDAPMTVEDMPPGTVCYGRILSGIVIKYRGAYVAKPGIALHWYKEFPHELGIRRCEDGSYAIPEPFEYERWFTTGPVRLVREEYETDEYSEMLESWPKLSLTCPEDGN